MLRYALPLVAITALLIACGDDHPDGGPADAGRAADAVPATDAENQDAPNADAAIEDAPNADAANADATNADATAEDATAGDATAEDASGEDAMIGTDAMIGRDAIPGDAIASGDSGPTDAMIGRDAGRPDLGVPGDAGLPVTCPVGQEGCECSSTATTATSLFLQDNCQIDLLCVPWDVIGNRVVGTDIFAPVQTCVHPCVVDADCGANRFCRTSGLDPSTGAGSFCVDRIAGYDEPCSVSRLDYEQIIDPATQDFLSELVACDDGLTCQLGQFADSFNPDEAVCERFCQADADCVATPQLQYCNPRIFATSSTAAPFLGVCSDAQHPNGAICGSTDPNKTFQFATACDTSATTCGATTGSCPVCININLDANTSLTPQGTGICMSPCNATAPCFGSRTCIPNFFVTGDGVCSDGCTALPETCPGVGSLGNGQDCLELFGGASFCTDRYTPVLAPAMFDATGNLISMGADCVGDLNNYSFFRCPEASTCLPVGAPGPGICVFGCSPGNPTSGDALCQAALGQATAVCTSPQPGIGICGN